VAGQSSSAAGARTLLVAPHGMALIRVVNTPPPRAPPHVAPASGRAPHSKPWFPPVSKTCQLEEDDVAGGTFFFGGGHMIHLELALLHIFKMDDSRDYTKDGAYPEMLSTNRSFQTLRTSDLWYPDDILYIPISGVQISSKTLPHNPSKSSVGTIRNMGRITQKV